MDVQSLEYVIGVLKGEKANIQPDWYDVLGFITANRVAGLFYCRAEKSSLHIPFKIKNILAKNYHTQIRWVSLIRKYAAELSEKLRTNQAEHIFLKGSVFVAQTERDAIYADGERISNDIDILVRPDGIGAVSEALKEAGYVQGRFDSSSGKIVPYSRLEILKRRMTRGETAPFVKLTGNDEFPFWEVDVNFSLGNEPSSYQDLLDKMIDSRYLYRGKTELFRADKELFFLHLILHQHKESILYFSAERGKMLDLYKLADIYYLWRSEQLKKDRLRKLSKEFKIERELSSVLRQTARVFADAEMMKMAKEVGDEETYVYDYETQKRYVWTAEERVRLLSCDDTKYLKENESL